MYLGIVMCILFRLGRYIQLSVGYYTSLNERFSINVDKFGTTFFGSISIFAKKERKKYFI